MRRALIVLNPLAGSSDADRVREAVARTATDELHCDVRVIAAAEAVTAAVRAALPAGFDVVAAAGGDGTVSAVASAVVHSNIPLGIIPVGTGNVLARYLGIPLDLDDALRLLGGPLQTRTLDAIQIGQQFYLLTVSVGLSAVVFRETTVEDKRRLGRLAYLLRGLRALLGFQPQRFTLTVDGKSSRVRAAEIVVTNTSTVGDPNIRWGPHVRMDDGVLDVCIVRARAPLDYLTLAWNLVRGRTRDPRLRFLRATESVIIAASRPLAVEADGDFIGHTPVHIQVAPAAVRVIVP